MEDSDGSITSPQQPNKPTNAAAQSVAKKPPAVRCGSTDSTTSTESSVSSSTVTPTARNSQTPTAANKQTTKPETPASSVRKRGSIELVAEKKPFQSRFLPNHQTPKKDETESSSSEEESSTEESDDDEEEQGSKISSPMNTSANARTNRSSQSRDSYADSKRNSRDETSRLGYGSPSRASDDTKPSTTSSIRSRAAQNSENDDHSNRYAPGGSR